MKRLLPSLLFVSLFFISNIASAQCDPWIQQAYRELYNRTATAEECNIKNYNNGSWSNYNELVRYIKAYNDRKSSGTCDPWIQQAYRQLYNRAATTEECNIRNYNNGSWSSYDDLVRYIKAYQSSKTDTLSMPAVTGDPWIFQAYKELYNRTPNGWEVNVLNYNGGSWKNYAELKNYIRDFQNSLARQKTTIKTGPFGNNIAVGFYIDGQQVAVNVVEPNGGKVVAAGGNNVISAGGDNVIAPGGGNVISPSGGYITVSASMAGVSFGNKYVTQSAGTRVISTSGKGALIIK